MTRCLRDRTLWLMREGEGRPGDHAHLRDCASCTARYDRLVRDLDAIEDALRAAPAEAFRPAAPTGRLWRLALAAALLVALGLGAVQAWRWSPAGAPAPASTGLADALPFLGEVSAVLAPGDAATLSSGEPVEPLLLMDAAPEADPDSESMAEPKTQGDPS